MDLSFDIKMPGEKVVLPLTVNESKILIELNELESVDRMDFLFRVLSKLTSKEKLALLKYALNNMNEKDFTWFDKAVFFNLKNN